MWDMCDFMVFLYTEVERNQIYGIYVYSAAYFLILISCCHH